jgi:hypothetical protein
MSTPWADWSGWGLSATSQGYEPNAKDDTLYLGRSGTGVIAELATDLSQHGDDQSAGASWHWEPSATAGRFNVQDWCCEVDVDDVTTATAARAFSFGSGGSGISLRFGNVAGQVDIIVAGATRGALALPGVSGSGQRFVIGWIAEANPRTTGAADAIRSTLYAWNLDTGAYAQAVHLHVVRSSGTTDFIWWASSTGGANNFTGTKYSCRFNGSRVHTVTETHEDFVDPTATPTLELATRCEFPIVDPDCVLGEAGQLVGPVHFMGAQAVQQNVFRAFSPIVNEAYLNRLEITASTFAQVPTQHRLAGPDDAWTLFSPFLFYRPIPPAATHLRVRVFIKQWNLGGRMRVCCYALNRPQLGAAVVDMGEALVAPFCDAIASVTDHGSGGTDGEWLDLGLVVPAVNSDGCTWLAFGFDTLGNPGTTVFEIGAIVVEPGVVE